MREVRDDSGLCLGKPGAAEAAGLYRALGELLEGSSLILFLWRLEPSRWPAEVASRNVAELLEFAEEDFASGRIAWQDITHPEDAPRLEEELRAFIAEGRLSWSGQYRLVSRAGRVLWVEAQHRATRDLEGRATHLLAFVQDITERRRAEEALHESVEKYCAFFDEADEGIALMPIDGAKLSVNRAFARMHGYASPEEMRLLRLQDLDAPETALLAPERLRRIQTEGAQNFDVEHYRSDGSTFFLNVTCKLTRIGGKPYFLGIHRDITGRRQAEETLRRVRTLESLGTAAGGIAHDFNNLLMGVFGNIELAKLDLPSDHPALAPLETAHQALDHARHLTTRLLTFARGGNPVLETVDLRQRICDTVRFHLAGSAVAPHFDIPEDLWPVRADKGQIAEVLSNLTVNAREAMPGGGLFRVRARNMPDLQEELVPGLRGDFVKLDFTDEGIGIPASLLGRIFEPYFTTKKVGSGLGLAIVHGILSRHGGDICVKSSPEAGATFTVFLPADPAAPSPATENPKHAAGAPPRASGRLLVMDDELVIRRTTTRMLERLGFAAETATDGAEAIALFAEASKLGRPFDLTILDLTIPGGMGGKEALGALRAMDPSARVIVSSGYSSDPVLADFAGHGFDGRLVKPFSLEDLREALSRALKRT